MFASAAVATFVWCGSMGRGMPMPGDWMMSMAWMRMPAQSWAGAAVMFAAMWAVMMIAMMMPSLAPVMLHHRRPVRAACGYFSLWIAAGALVFPLGVALAAAEMRWPAVARLVPMATGFALVAAGIAQLTRWKRRALAQCRDRACCALGRRPGPAQAWRDGWRLGRHCIACCSPPILVLLVLGVMDAGVMALVTAAITAERLAPWPRLAARGFGIAALAGGAIAIAIAP